VKFYARPNQEGQFTTNLMLKNEIQKKNQFKKFVKVKKKIKRIGIKSDRKKIKEG